MRASTKEKKKPVRLSVKESEIRYRRLFEAAQDGILILNAKTGMINDVNPFLIYLLGYSREEFIKKKLWEVGAFKDIKASKDAFLDLQKKAYIRYKDLPLRTKDGKLVQVEFVSNVYKAGGEDVIQCNIRDITERKQAQDALLKKDAILREQSMRDHLTGLFNRRYLEETLERELFRASRKNLSVGIIIMDVDHFKRFNDTYGHAAGDAILQKLGTLLLGCVRREDIPTRYGGDEFVVVLPDASRKVTCGRAERICEDARHITILYKARALEKLTLSLGIAVFPQDGSSSAAVLQVADQALYRAKHEGRDQVSV
jgi:diguanylate cyclase (GGDEF)-like protein/PAS domain S-box-containing protein